MRIHPRFTVPILTGILGVFLGAMGIVVIAEKQIIDDLGRTNRLAVYERVQLLGEIRKGKIQEAITEQEILLAGDVTTLDFLAKNWKSQREDSKEALGRVSKYLENNPNAFEFQDLRRQVVQSLLLSKNY